MTLRSILPAALLLALVATAAPALAQEEGSGESGAQSDDQARELYVRGDRLYAEGHYEESLAAFEEAFQLSGRSALLFNIANVHERLGNLERARATLQRYAPDAPEEQRETVLARIANLERRLREQDNQRRAEAAANAVATPPSGVGQAEPNVGAPAPEPVAQGGDGVLIGIGATLAAGGGAALAAGIVFGVLALDRHSTLEDRCMDGLCPADSQIVMDEEAAFALASDILLIGGAAFALTGIVLIAVGATSGDSESAALTFQPRAGGATFELSGAF